MSEAVFIRYDRCRLCGDPHLEPAYDLFDVRPVTVVRCGNCGFHFQNPVPPETEARYRSPLTTRKLRTQWDMQAAVFRQRLGRIQRYEPALRDLRGRRVLDVGAGAAVFLRICRDAGADVMGIEWGVAETVTREYGIDIVERPVEDPWWADNHSEAFDLITIFDVLEHVYEPHVLIDAALLLLKKDGVLFVSTPCRDSAMERLGRGLYRLSGGRFRRILNARYNRHHVHIFSTEELRRLCEGQGLCDIRTETRADYSCATWLYIYKFAVPHKRAARLLGALLAPLLKLLPLSNKAFVFGRRARTGSGSAT